MRILKILVSGLILSGFFEANGLAQIKVVNFGSGSSDSDAWVNVNSATFPGYPTWPGSAPWLTPIGSNGNVSGDADLYRVAGNPTGGPYLAGSSIYFFGTNPLPNAIGGTLRVSDLTPLANLKTLTFQIQIGEVSGYDLYSAPALKINGGSSVVNPLFSGILDRFQNGIFRNPETDVDEPVYVNTRGYQWDVSSLATVTSFAIDFSGVTHSQVYGLQLDQSSSVFSTALVPEPNVGELVLAAACFFLIRRRACVVA